MDWSDYEVDGQLSIFDLNTEVFKITKPIRLIEIFAGVGSQAMALRDLGADFEHYRVVEFDKYAIKSYNAIHGTDFPTMDVTEIKGIDLGIEDVKSFTYLLTYLLIPLSRLICCRFRQRYAKGKWYKKRFALGSRKIT